MDRDEIDRKFRQRVDHESHGQMKCRLVLRDAARVVGNLTPSGFAQTLAISALESSLDWAFSAIDEGSNGSRDESTGRGNRIIDDLIVSRFFLDLFEDQDRWDLYDFVPEETDLPAGWTFLGRGVSRFALLSPDGWVYKIGEAEANNSEVKMSNLLYLESDSSAYFPYAEHVMSLKDGELSIIRMEYIEGTTATWLTCNVYDLGEVCDFILERTNQNVTDIHGNNIVMRDNVPCLIDMAD